jgi:hypothetical protein
VLRLADVFVGFLPRLAGWHEHHFVQAELGGYFTGRNQVAVMDGIKRPAHHAQPQPSFGTVMVQNA